MKHFITTFKLLQLDLPTVNHTYWLSDPPPQTVSINRLTTLLMYGTFSDYSALTHSMEQIPPSEVYISKRCLDDYQNSDSKNTSIICGVSGKFPNVSHKNFPVLP
jgi:hypothetical protein